MEQHPPLVERVDPKPLTPHRVIADRVKELRKDRGWSAERLAQEMTNAGIPWERMVVTKLETGRRQSISVEEFLTLAYVLEVAPVHLVVPPTDSDRPEIGGYAEVSPVPNMITTPGYMRAWIRGQTPIGRVDARRYFSQVPEEEFKPAMEWTPELIERQSAAIRAGREPRGDG